MTAPLVAGTIATEIAIKAAKIVRTNVMAELSGEATVTVNLTHGLVMMVRQIDGFEEYSETFAYRRKHYGFGQ